MFARICDRCGEIMGDEVGHTVTLDDTTYNDICDTCFNDIRSYVEGDVPSPAPVMEKAPEPKPAMPCVSQYEGVVRTLEIPTRYLHHSDDSNALEGLTDASDDE